MSLPKKIIHISEDRIVSHGKSALVKLKEENDTVFFRQGKGVYKVDKKRWKQAQSFEYKVWMRDYRRAREDRNNYHTKAFNGYLALRNRKFCRGIEMGCGPFTNMRNISAEVEIKEIHLLDPLLDNYLCHPHCTYDEAGLKVERPILGGRLSISRRMPAVLHNLAIEEFQDSRKFDLVVLINVLEHCFDADRVFDTILRQTEPGAVLVFADKYYKADDLADDLHYRYDAGHPLKIDQSIIDEWLDKNFMTLYKNVNYIPRSKERASWTHHEELYFMGRRKNQDG